MSGLKGNKISQLMAKWLPGAVMTTRWLLSQGYSAQLLQTYTQNGWIKLLGKGAYSRLEETVEWPGALNALQTQLHLPVHLGGISALEHYGLAQNVPFTVDTFYVFNTTERKHKLPRWFLANFPGSVYLQYHLFDTDVAVDTVSINQLPVLVSAPERAILEVLALVPHAFDYEDAVNLVENCRLARADIFQTLLENCLSIKVKRLFLYLADKCQLPTFKDLNIETLELGTGSRTIGEGGEYIPAYQLIVPRLAYHEGAGHV